MGAKNFTIKDIADGLKKGEFSAEEIFTHYQNKIKKENKTLNAYLSVFDKHDANIQMHTNDANILAGVPCAIKDNLLIDGTIATAGSKILKNYVSSYNATVIKKLRTAGVNFLGKTNLDEFAMGSSTENSAFGPTKNPLDLSRVPGGSSGGSAAVVAADLAVFALGSDTGGSIRQPASFCGIVGLKPTYGRVSRYGLTAFASSFDTIGPFAKNIDDIALVLSIIAGYDENDSTSQNMDVPKFNSYNNGDKKYKIGLPKEYFAKGLNEEIRNAILEKVEFLKKAGHEIINIELPHTEYSIATYYILTTAEASSNLARFDGARYGYRSKDSNTLRNMYLNSRTEGFGTEVKRRIMLGTYVLSAGYYDAYYRKAQKVRRLIKNDFDRAFEKVDLILTPTTPTTAFKLGEKSNDPLEMYLEDIYTTSANLVGIPGMNIPIGKDKQGLPIGMQLMANQFEENKLLTFCSDF